jgi:hypothetical protein
VEVQRHTADQDVLDALVGEGLQERKDPVEVPSSVDR